jgi:hypothetical protein
VKIVIAGQGKSGATAQLFKLLKAFEQAPATAMEPAAFRPWQNTNALAVVLIDAAGRLDFDSLAGFGCKILLVPAPILHQYATKSTFRTDIQAYSVIDALVQFVSTTLDVI